jgi:hypothetical protein
MSGMQQPGQPAEIARYNLLGQEIRAEDGGLQIILYDDGSTRKTWSKGTH